MAQTYGVVNLISSFGFSHRWRQACVRAVQPAANLRCADLMCGMGEATLLLATAQEGTPTIVESFDFCPEMVRRAGAQMTRKRVVAARVALRDVLTLPREPTYDRIVCSFGLKTLDDTQLAALAPLVAALLRPGGRAAFVEISVPRFLPLRVAYLFYLRHVIPLIGWLFLGHPACYRWLARYTEDFARRDRFAAQLTTSGLVVAERPLFFGCAKLFIAQNLSWGTADGVRR